MKENNKIKHIMNDFVSCEEYCNMNCQYCLSEGAQLKENHNFERIDGKINFRHDKQLLYYLGQEYKEKVDRTLENYYKYFDAPIFKISGGEITLVRNYSDILKQWSKKYEVVQLLTNGVLLNEESIKELSQINNINVELSLDGHTFAMNACRFTSQALFEKVMHNLDLLYRYRIDTEIYCVLTNVNIVYFKDFCDFILTQYKNRIRIVPFPVRLLGARKFFPTKDQLESLKAVISDYIKYDKMLPAKAYMDEMYEFIYSGERKTRCYVPRIMCQIFDDGVISPCPNCWTVKIGNLNEDIEKIKNNMETHPIYRVMLNKSPSADFCKHCFTDYHIFNLYIEGKISLEQLVINRPDFQGENVKKRLMQLRDEIRMEDFRM